VLIKKNLIAVLVRVAFVATARSVFKAHAYVSSIKPQRDHGVLMGI